jgi:hypothetical protein
MNIEKKAYKVSSTTTKLIQGNIVGKEGKNISSK